MLEIRLQGIREPQSLEFEIVEAHKEGQPVIAFLIHAVPVPLVFERPGQYDIGGGKQKTAFSTGTVYFRHGAKSEPGSTSDIRIAIEHYVEVIRKSWIKGVRKIVHAPLGSEVIVAHPVGRPPSETITAVSLPVRAVRDPGASPVFLTRDSSKASYGLVHETVSASR